MELLPARLSNLLIETERPEAPPYFSTVLSVLSGKCSPFKPRHHSAAAAEGLHFRVSAGRVRLLRLLTHKTFNKAGYTTFNKAVYKTFNKSVASLQG